MNHLFAALLAAATVTGEPPTLPGEIEAARCPAWVEETYRIESLIEEHGLDLEDEYAALAACVERDSSRMKPVIPVGWCDNVLKVHCSALDLMVEIVDAEIARCERLLEGELGIDLDALAEWRGCASDEIYDRYVLEGHSNDLVSCRQALEDACGARLPAAARVPIPPGISWPRWGGPGGDFVAPASALAETWDEAGPPTLWSRPLGEGYSAILYEDGRLYTMYRSGEDEIVVALDATSGETIWEHRDARPPHPRVMPQWGLGPRSTPLLAGDRLFTVGVAGHFVALDKRDGTVLWSRELWGDELGGRSRGNGYSSSPLAWKGWVIVPVGAVDGGVIAFDQADGSVVWRSAGFENSYSSPAIVELAGRPQLLMFMAEELVGLDPETGAVLWSYPHKNPWKQNIHQPAVLGDLVFLSSPQAGARTLRLTAVGDGFEVEELWSSRRIQLYHVSSVLDGEWLYGSTGTASPAFMTGVNIRTGEIAWRERGVAKANCVAADGRLVILDEDGVLYLATATPQELDIEARADLLDRHAWTVPTIVGTTLFARDNVKIVAVELGS